MIKINILELIYPKTCGMCNKISKSYICNKCKLKLKKILKLNKINFNDKYFDSLTYLFRYEGNIRTMILEYKFKDKSYLYKFFSEIIVNNCNLKNKYDIILPVPIHKKRKLQRGYNQSELIAKDIAKNIDIEYSNSVLQKIKNTLPQSSLNKSQRINNVLGVYSIIKPQYINDKKIILMDDIYTTGSTVNECSKILKKNGAILVDVLTLAKD